MSFICVMIIWCGHLQLNYYVGDGGSLLPKRWFIKQIISIGARLCGSLYFNSSIMSDIATGNHVPIPIWNDNRQLLKVAHLYRCLSLSTVRP